MSKTATNITKHVDPAPEINKKKSTKTDRILKNIFIFLNNLLSVPLFKAEHNCFVMVDYTLTWHT